MRNQKFDEALNNQNSSKPDRKCQSISGTSIKRIAFYQGEDVFLSISSTVQEVSVQIPKETNVFLTAKSSTYLREAKSWVVCEPGRVDPNCLVN